jgi:hypothetical protein
MKTIINLLKLLGQGMLLVLFIGTVMFIVLLICYAMTLLPPLLEAIGFFLLLSIVAAFVLADINK